MKEKLLLLKHSTLQMTKTKQYMLFFGVSSLALLGFSGLVGMKFFGKSASATDKATVPMMH